MIFGGGDETPSEPSDGDEAFPDDEANPDDDSDDLISDTGDTTVLSVAAVALVAGAALVLTRKKSEDAE
jgi:LPXTG-motif cell wall-anchored protein